MRAGPAQEFWCHDRIRVTNIGEKVATWKKVLEQLN